MLIKILDFFINKKARQNQNLLLKFRFLAAMMLVFMTFNIFVLLLTRASLFQDQFNSQLYVVILLGIMVVIKFSVNIRLASISFILLSFWLVLSVINVSGGIYSYNIKWLVIIILFSVLFDYKAVGKILLFCTFIAFFSTFYFYLIESYAHRSDYETFMQLTKSDYFIENILFFIIFLTILFFYYLYHRHLLNSINKNTTVLENQYKLNAAKTNELKNIKEKLEESNRDLKRYAHATSHDLKEPLRTITSFTQLLKKELSTVELSQNAHEYLNYIELGGSKMYHLVEDALTLSELNNIETESFEPLDVNVIIEEVSADLSEQIEQAEATILFKNLPRMQGNRSEIKRLFQHLISNAIKFAKENVPPQITISYQLKNNKQIL